jgi:hypothetical protein
MNTFILVGQWIIVTFGGGMFNVVPLSLEGWGSLIGVTSLVLWAGEIDKITNCRNSIRSQAHR